MVTAFTPTKSESYFGRRPKTISPRHLAESISRRMFGVARSATTASSQRTISIPRRFSIPLRTITPGDYIFTFGSGDDGWLFDVGASTILTLTITPAPAQPSQAVTPAEEAASR